MIDRSFNIMIIHEVELNLCIHRRKAGHILDRVQTTTHPFTLRDDQWPWPARSRVQEEARVTRANPHRRVENLHTGNREAPVQTHDLIVQATGPLLDPNEKPPWWLHEGLR